MDGTASVSRQQDYTTQSPTTRLKNTYVAGRQSSRGCSERRLEILPAVSQSAIGKIHGGIFSTGLAARIDHGPSTRLPNAVDRAVMVFPTNVGSRRSTPSGGLMTAKSIALLTGLIALDGCAGVRYPNYYTLNLPNPPSASHGSAPISGTVVVREFRAPEYLRQERIVYRPEPEQIAFYDYQHWAEDPRRTVTAAIVGNLQQLFKSAELYDGRTDADFLLTGSLDRLEELDNGNSVSVDVRISATLHDLKTGDVIWSGTSSKTSAVEQRSISGIVAAMSRDLSEATGQLPWPSPRKRAFRARSLYPVNARLEKTEMPESKVVEQPASGGGRLKQWIVPALILAMAVAIVAMIAGNWNAWASETTAQETDDAYTRADLTPLSTKVAGLVAKVTVSDYQSVKTGDLLVQLRDDDFGAQVQQAEAGVASGEASLINNQRQKELQDARILQAGENIHASEAQIKAADAGIEAAHSAIANARSGIEGAKADTQRTQLERRRQEALIATESATRQKVEQVVADQQRYEATLASREADLAAATAQLASREADLARARAQLAGSSAAELEAQKRQRAVLDSAGRLPAASRFELQARGHSPSRRRTRATPGSWRRRMAS